MTRSVREVQRRWEALETVLSRPTPPPLPGQETIPVATIGHHRFEGDGPACQADWFGQACGAHRDEHQHTNPPR